jgi:hypothetical protein
MMLIIETGWGAYFHRISKDFRNSFGYSISADLPHRADFLAGQYFDIRLEVHAPVNGSEATGKAPDTAFSLTIAHEKGAPQNATTFFKVNEPALERWNFTWFEGTQMRKCITPSYYTNYL